MSASAQDLTGALVGFCNPLLDISVTNAEELLKKYNLKANDAILAGDEHKPLYDDLVTNYNPDFVVGGAGQNTLRGAQRLLPPKFTIFFGAVGKDENGRRLREAANKDGLEVCYMENPNLRTGVCGVLITDHNRSLCTDLLAANTYDVCHVKQPENWAHIEKAKYYYVTGYFYTVSPETIELVAKHALEHKKTFTANLSAPFVPVAYTDALRRTIPYIDILFGNETEALAFAQAFDLGTTNLEKIAHAAANMPKHDSSRPRIVVFTHGNNPTIVAIQGEDVLKEYPVTYIPNEEIADTNGAGDAFVAGFLSQLLLERPLTDCIEAGNWLAGKVIREVGPTYPAGKLEFVPSQSIAPVLKKIDV